MPPKQLSKEHLQQSSRKVRKNNLPYQISYFLLIFVFFLGAVFYRQSFLAILLLLVCLLPPLSLWATYGAIQKTDFALLCKSASLVVKNPLSVQLQVQNRSVFPLLNCELYFTFSNLFYEDQPDWHALSVSAQAKRTIDYTLHFDTSRSGMFCLEAANIQITDYLHLHSFTVPFSRKLNIPIFPEKRSVQIGYLPQSNDAAEDGDIQKRYGAISTESQGVREYHPGDRLQNIHWKMSAKADDLLVRDPQPIAERFLLVLPELERDHLEDTLSAFYSFGCALIKEHEIFQAALFCHMDRTFQLRLITDEDQLTDALLALYYMPSYIGNSIAREHYIRQYGESAEYLSVCGSDIIYYQGGTPIQ